MTQIAEDFRVYIDAMSNSTTCVCGHAREAHQHFRKGADCGVCGPVACPRFRAVPFWRRPRRGADAPDVATAGASDTGERTVVPV